MALSIADLDNDARGWILSFISGLACVFGSSVICVDAFVRLFPGKRSFRVENSTVFQACSLSLSFGVMLFTSLYSMLPESRSYLKNDGWPDQPAGLVVMAGFVVGFVGIQVVSRLLHRYIPSHVVDCTHSHGGHDPASHSHGEDTAHTKTTNGTSRDRSRTLSRPSRPRHRTPARTAAAESTPLLSSHDGPGYHHYNGTASTSSGPPSEVGDLAGPDAGRRPSMVQVQSRVMSFVKDTKTNCDAQGSCYGFTDPCGQECYKHLRHGNGQATTVLRAATMPLVPGVDSHSHTHPHDHDDHDDGASSVLRTSRATSRDPAEDHHHLDHDHDDDHAHDHDHGDDDDDVEAQHHHHVPTNAFLSIGLQTSLAIALHKFPEGFITYATNHANPALGFNVFMALFIHNISEGFAMALPLYMALGSRWRAMLWSTLLGGLSQPFGAGVAALYFHFAGRTGHAAPDPVAYACLFALTAGIMVSVALQLFVESLSLNHDRNLCIFFAFLGMVLLGVSNALFSH